MVSINTPAGSTSTPLHSAVSEKDGMFLYQLIVDSKFTRTLEVGLAFGISAMYMCLAHSRGESEGTHTAIDPNQSKERWSNVGLDNLTRAGLHTHMQHISEASETVLPRLVQQGQVFDLIFIDGNHSFEHVFVDAFYSERLLKEGGILYFDDNNWPGVHKAISYFYRNRSHVFEIIETPTYPFTVAFRKVKTAGSGPLNPF